jgi:hypothetical protein
MVPCDGGYVGKCPSDLDDRQAQRLLDDGIMYWGRNRRKPRPERVYNIHRGIPHRAHLMGGRYHGFPEIPSEIPPSIRDELRARAVAERTVDAFDEWMEKYKDL